MGFHIRMPGNGSIVLRVHPMVSKVSSEMDEGRLRALSGSDVFPMYLFTMGIEGRPRAAECEGS